MNKNTSVLFSISFLFILLITFIIYSYGLGGYFIFDDFVNLQRMNDYGGATHSLNSFLYYLFGNGSIGGRAISYLSFLINDNSWPGDPASFKLTNIYIHLLNGILVFILARKISELGQLSSSDAIKIALLTMALWLVHPLNVSTVLYTVQRMTELSTLFSLLCVIFYLKGRIYFQQSGNFRKFVLIFFLALFFLVSGFLSKENAVVSLLFIGIIEFLFFNRDRPKNFKIIFSVFIVLPVLVLVLYFSYFTSYTNAFEYRGHTQLQHIFTETRVLIDYLLQLVSPDINRMGIIHDDFTISQSLLEPITTLWSLLFIVLLIVLAFLVRKPMPLVSFGILWFFAGHSLESSFFPLEIYFEHRNYLPGIGLMISLAYLTIYLINQIQRVALKYIVLFSVTAILLILSLQTYSLTVLWGNTPLQMALTYQTHPDSLRATHNFAIAIRNNHPDKAYELYQQLYHKTKNLNALFYYAIITCEEHNKLPLPANQLLKEVSQLKPTGVTYFNVKKFSQTLLNHQCITPGTVFLDHLFTALENNPYVSKRPGDLARILYLHADIAHSLGNTDGAILLLDEAFKRKAGLAILQRQVDFLYNRQKYNEALEYLNKAILFHKKQGVLKPQAVPLENLLTQKAFIIKTMEEKTESPDKTQ